MVQRLLWLPGGMTNCETQLGLLAVINRKAFEHEAPKARASSTATGIVHHETLQASAIVRKLPNTVQAEVNNFLANGIMSTGKVVGSILLTRDQLLWVEQLAVRPCANLVDYCWLQVNEHTPGNMLASSSLRKEGVEGIITPSNCFVGCHLPIWLNTVLQAEQFPACVTNLDTGLTEMNAKDFTHGWLGRRVQESCDFKDRRSMWRTQRSGTIAKLEPKW